MGIRSDVGLAISAELYSKMGGKEFDWLRNEAYETHTHPLGILFVFRETKWYGDDVYKLRYFLEENDEEEGSYFEAIACSESPELGDDDYHGDWWDNPWNLCKRTTVTLEFDSPEDS